MQKIAPAALLVLAGTLRFWGLTFGLPILSSLYIRPDESLIVMSAVNFQEKAGYPGTFAYPALMGEICAAVIHPVFWTWKAATGADFDNMPAHFGSDPSFYFLVLRAISAIAGTWTTVLVYFAGKRMGLGRWAFWAAVLYAVAPLAVRDAHFGVTDTMFVCLSMATVLAAFRYLDAGDAGRQKALWAVAVLFALTISTKYAGVLLAPALLFVVTRRPISRRAVLAAGALPIVGFLLLNPYHLLDLRRAAKEIYDILFWLYGWQPGDPEWTITRAFGQVLKPLRHGPLGYAGLAGAVLTAAAFGWRWRTHIHITVLAQSLAATTIALIPFQHTVPYRYLLPMLPPIALLLAAGCAWASQRIRAIGWPLESVVALGAIWLGVMPSMRLNQLLNETDTRTLAWNWIESNVPASVPLVWMGGPECEPQFRESANSIRRRIEFAYNRYGAFSGEIVSQPYRLMLNAAERSTRPGYEVYRNLPPEHWPKGQYVLITPAYPLSMAKTPSLPALAAERVGREFRVASLEGNWDDFELDLIDALFLPFRPLDRVIRPGPELHLRWIGVPTAATP